MGDIRLLGDMISELSRLTVMDSPTANDIMAFITHFMPLVGTGTREVLEEMKKNAQF